MHTSKARAAPSIVCVAMETPYRRDWPDDYEWTASWKKQQQIRASLGLRTWRTAPVACRSSRARYKRVDHLFRPRLVEIHRQLVAFHCADAAIAEFLVEDAVAACVGGRVRIGRLHDVRLRLDERRTRALRIRGAVGLGPPPARALIGAGKASVLGVVAETHITAIESLVDHR